MKLHRALLILATAIGCTSSSYPASPVQDYTTTSAIRVINASKVVLDVSVDGRSIVQGLHVADISFAFTVSPGGHVVHLQGAGGASTDVAVVTSLAHTSTAVAYSGTSSNIVANALVDTGYVVPDGKSKLRVVHLAGGAPAIEIWRTQPDFQTPVRIMTPFAYQAASPYLQSDPGVWDVFVTLPGSTAKVISTGAIPIQTGQRATVALLDSAGVMRFKVFVEQ